MRAWIGDRWDRLERWLGRNYLTPILAIAFFAVPVYLWLLWVATLLVLGEITRDPPAASDHAGHQQYVQTLGLAITGLGALLAVPLVLIRAHESKRQATIAEQAHITSRFSQAIMQLGTDKTATRAVRFVSYLKDGERHRFMVAFDVEGNYLDRIPEDVREEHRQRMESDESYRALPAEQKLIADRFEEVAETVPNLEVRLGAIYALEGISRDSEDYHTTVMENLCSYIRRNAPARDAPDHPEDADDKTLYELASWQDERVDKVMQWFSALTPPRDDIQAALTVIGRRSDDRIEFESRVGYRPNLHETNLRGADLSSLKFDRADLREARLEQADLRGARLEGAKLREARLERATLFGARLEGAELTEARLGGAFLWGARLERADLSNARLGGAHFLRTRLERADLSGADLSGANLLGENLSGAELLGAGLSGADLSGANLSAANLSAANLSGANLSGANLSGANLSGAWLESAQWAGATIGASPAHSAYFTGGKNLTQTQLAQVIGNDETILPRDAETGEQLYVCSCWEKAPPNIEELIARVYWGDRDKRRQQWLCADGEVPRKVGKAAEAD